MNSVTTKLGKENVQVVQDDFVDLIWRQVQWSEQIDKAMRKNEADAWRYEERRKQATQKIEAVLYVACEVFDVQPDDLMKPIVDRMLQQEERREKEELTAKVKQRLRDMAGISVSS